MRIVRQRICLRSNGPRLLVLRDQAYRRMSGGTQNEIQEMSVSRLFGKDPIGLLSRLKIEDLFDLYRDPSRYQRICLVSPAFLGLHRRDGNSVDDVCRRAAAGKIVAGTVKALKNGADRASTGQPFGQLIGDVARI